MIGETMETIEIQVYEFDELDEKAKEKAIEHARKNLEESDFASDLIEENLIMLAEEKFKENKITWNKYDKTNVHVIFDIYGNYAYPLGIFELTDESLKRQDNVAKLLSDDEIIDRHYIKLVVADENSMRLYDSEGNCYYCRGENYPPDIAEKMISVYNDICYDLLKSARADFEYYESDEYISSDLRDNAFKFMKDGRAWRY